MIKDMKKLLKTILVILLMLGITAVFLYFYLPDNLLSKVGIVDDAAVTEPSVKEIDDYIEIKVKEVIIEQGEDTSPISGDFSVFGNLDVTGSIAASKVIAEFEGDLIGSVYGNLGGDGSDIFNLDVSSVIAGVLNPLYYSAYSDLSSEGYLDNNSGSDLLTRSQADALYSRLFEINISNVSEGILDSDYYSAYLDLDSEGYLDNSSGDDLLTRSQADVLYSGGGSGPEVDPVFLASDVYGIVTADIANWNTTYGWGNHASSGYITDGNTNWNNSYGFITDGNTNWDNSYGYITSYTETDPVYGASASSGITGTNITNWNTAYGWGDHASAGYITSPNDTVSGAELDGVFSTNGILRRTGSGTYSVTTDNSTNWNTTYGWGNHASIGYITDGNDGWDNSYGYITSYTETDPVYGASASSGITGTNITNWNAAYGWGDHGLAGYLTSFTELDPQVGANTLNYVSKWDGSALVASGIYENAGQVGIGTASTSQALDLIGSLELEATTTSTSGVIYKGTDRFIHTFQHPTGGGAVPNGLNTFVGVSSGNFTTGSTAFFPFFASQNSAFGANSLPVVTTGYDLTAIGVDSLLVNTTGYQNTAVGVRSLLANTTGNMNTAIGIYSLNTLTEGIKNTAIGYQSGGGITTGNYNTILGAATGLASDLSNNIIIADGEGNIRINVDENGNVGIGTVSPYQPLSIGGVTSGITTGIGLDGGSVGGTVSQINMRSGSGDTIWQFVTRNDTFGLSYGGSVDQNQALSILNDGSIGIGDTTPDHLLDIAGNIGLDASGYINWGDTDGISGYGLFDNAGTLQFKNNSGSWTDVGSGDASAFLDLSDTMASFTAGSVLFTSGSAVTQDNSNFFWDDSNNRLGLGTTLPLELLDVNGRILISDSTAPGTTTNRLYSLSGDLYWNGGLIGGGTRQVTLEAEYEGAVLSADGSTNVGNMFADNTGSTGSWMNYYQWSSSETVLNDYDVRVRFTLPSDFTSWDTNAIVVDYVTQTTTSTDNQLNISVYLESSGTADYNDNNNVSSVAGTWTTTTILDTGLSDCDTAGEACVLVLQMQSKNDNYVRVGDLTLNYNN
jgi:hypothetical protein